MRSRRTAPQAARLVLWVGCLLLPVLAATGPRSAAHAETKKEKLAAIDRDIKLLQSLVDQYNAGNYLYPVPMVGIIAVSKDALAQALATLVYMGELKPSDIPAQVRRVRKQSEATFENLRQQIAKLRAERQRIVSGGSPTPGPARGTWHLKQGFPKVVNKNNNDEIAAVESDVNGGSMTYHYTRWNYQKQVTHEYTLQATYPDLDNVAWPVGARFNFMLSGTWTRGKDAGLYDGQCPQFSGWGGVTVTAAEPRLPNKSAADSALLVLGRFTDGRDHPSDSRRITVEMPRTGSECSYSMSLDQNHCITWTFER